MAKGNYYEHSARRCAKEKYTTAKEIEACRYGFEKGFQLALESLRECNVNSKQDLDIWIGVWTSILTDESEWDY